MIPSYAKIERSGEAHFTPIAFGSWELVDEIEWHVVPPDIVYQL